MLSVQVKRERSPNILNYNYKELVQLDSISVDLMPEKKGLLLKHVEYEVKSEVSYVWSHLGLGRLRKAGLQKLAAFGCLLKFNHANDNWEKVKKKRLCCFS